MSPPRLALVMIARDESRCIARCLDSVRPHVDQMIVLDTGSTDATVEIAAACGAQVHRFAWCDDFAAARNAALDRSDADWNLILDADEWLEAGGEYLASPALDGAPFLGEAAVISVMEANDQQGRTWIPRLLPRGVRYVGRVHEQPASDLPLTRTALTIGHDGYLAENLARKAGRNEALLLAELQIAPQDAYLWFQLGKEYQVREAPAQAALCFAEALRLSAPDATFRHALVVRALTALKTDGQLDAARELADAELAHWQTSPDFFFALGDLYLEVASQDPEAALTDHLPVVEFAWKRCLEIGDRDDLDGSVRGRGGRMAAHNLAVFYESLGQAEQAAVYRELAAQLGGESS